MRTVANIRSYFTKVGGALGTQGCVSFMFDHKCVFKVKKDGPVDMDELELELIDYGVDDVYKDDEDGLIYIYGEFESFGAIQKYLEDNGFTIVSNSPPRKRKASSSSSTSSRTTTTYRTSTTPWNWLMKNNTTLK